MRASLALHVVALAALATLGCSDASQAASDAREAGAAGEPDASHEGDASRTPNAPPAVDASADTSIADGGRRTTRGLRRPTAAFPPMTRAPRQALRRSRPRRLDHVGRRNHVGRKLPCAALSPGEPGQSFDHVRRLGADRANHRGRQALPPSHEGHPGYTIDDSSACAPACNGITPLVPAAITTYEPNIVLLMIGTNDVFLSLDLANAPARLGKLIDTITSLDPAILVVVAQIIPSTDDAQNLRTQTYNAAMPALVQARAAAGQHVFLVDMYSAFVAEPSFKTKYMSDSLHPSDLGAEVMASTWYAAVGPLFK